MFLCHLVPPLLFFDTYWVFYPSWHTPLASRKSNESFNAEALGLKPEFYQKPYFCHMCSLLVWNKKFLSRRRLIRCLGLHFFTAKGLGWIPGWGTKITQATWYGQNKQTNKQKNQRTRERSWVEAWGSSYSACTLVPLVSEVSLHYHASSFINLVDQFFHEETDFLANQIPFLFSLFWVEFFCNLHIPY